MSREVRSKIVEVRSAFVCHAYKVISKNKIVMRGQAVRS